MQMAVTVKNRKICYHGKVTLVTLLSIYSIRFIHSVCHFLNHSKQQQQKQKTTEADFFLSFLWYSYILLTWNFRHSLISRYKKSRK